MTDKPQTTKSLHDMADDLALELRTMVAYAKEKRIPNLIVIEGMEETLDEWEKMNDRF